MTMIPCGFFRNPTSYWALWILATSISTNKRSGVVDAFANTITRQHDVQWVLLAKKDDDDEDSIDVSNKDWRAFRAKLVMGEPKATTKETPSETVADEPFQDDWDGIGALFQNPASGNSNETLLLTPLDPSQWAYDSGNVIEQGAVILGGLEQHYGFGLRQQYFHKAAILVLDHEESTFTKGIILNRPTDIELSDDQGLKWRVWFGGDVQGLAAPNPEFVCLHTLQSDAVKKASIPVMNDIQWTSFEVAKSLVQSGLAKPEDFWLFCGYAGWGPKQLSGELERKSWYMVATDAVTLVQELQSLAVTADPRDAGLETWSLLMNMIGRQDTALQSMNTFDDLMLKEWAQQHLLDSTKKKKEQQAQGPWRGPLDRLLGRTKSSESVTSSSTPQRFHVGTLVRAANRPGRSPFLLESQELHKSLLLVISDDEVMTTAVILNLPGAQPVGMGAPLRYGGPYTIKGTTDPLLWLHCSSTLKQAKVGRSINPDTEEGIWKCSGADVEEAVGAGLATITDFLVVTGVSLFAKDNRETARGMQGEIQDGHFEIVDPERTEAVWNELSRQEVLSKDTLTTNMLLAREAWLQGNEQQQETSNGASQKTSTEEDDTIVFKTNVKVSKLADDALKSWVSTFLLGQPSLEE